MFKILFLLISDAFCGLSLNAKLLNKRGMDHGFIIETETQFIKEFNGTRPIRFKTKNGINIELVGNFIDTNETYGPSDLVVFKGDLFDNAGRPMKIFGNKPVVLKLGQEKKFEIKRGKGQILEFTIKPEVN
jgi:hypothetical protein